MRAFAILVALLLSPLAAAISDLSIYSEAKYTKLIVQLIHFLAIQMQKWEALLPELPQKAIKPAVELPAKVINVKEKNIAVRK